MIDSSATFDRLFTELSISSLRCFAILTIAAQRCCWKKTGVIYEHPLGGFPDAPLDTESGVPWIAYANEILAAQARPVLNKILKQFLV